MRHEDGFPSQSAFSHAQKFVHESGIWIGAIAHFCLEHDSFFEVVHGPGFRNDRLSGIHLDFHHLKIVADNFIIHFVTSHGCLFSLN
jgi:hypothetical protein